MGAPMARRLLGLGYRLLVHDVNREIVPSLVDCGARSMTYPKEIASEAELVLTCLPSLDALRAVAHGENDLHIGEAIKAHVDLSTTGPQFAREMAERYRRRGIMMLDSPITGNVVTAGNGKLGIMCSGPEAAFDLAHPILCALADVVCCILVRKRVRHRRSSC
jgi:3-hydroxyisobutyrate dehydrogenase-like beta-hydroxyacid dehydrogenase